MSNEQKTLERYCKMIADTFSKDDLQTADRSVLENLIIALYCDMEDRFLADLVPWDIDEGAIMERRAKMFGNTK